MSVLAAATKSSYMLIAGFALSLSLSSSAYALDGKSFIDTLQDGMSPYNLTLDYQTPNIKGDTLTLNNVRLLQRDGKDAPSLPIFLGTVRFDTVKAAPDGSFSVEKITSAQNEADNSEADKQAEGGIGRVIVSGIDISHAHISPKGKVYTIAEYLPYQNAAVKNITYRTEGKTILSLDNISAGYMKKADGIYQNISKIASFIYNPAAWPGQQGQNAKEMLSSLGYADIKGSFAAAAEWNPKTTNLNIGEYKITANNVGSLSLSGKLSGVSQNFANAYQKLALRQLEQKAPTDKEIQQMNQEAVSLAGQLNINNLKLVYQDDSLAGRILDYMSKSSAQPRNELVSVLKAGVLANVQNFQNQEFANHVAGQVNSFLDNPKSLQLTAQPQNPVAFSSVLLALGISPEQLISILGLDVSAGK